MLPDYSIRKIVFLIVQYLSELYNNFCLKICDKFFPDRVNVEWIIMRHRPAYFDYSKPEHFASLCYIFTDLGTIINPHTTVEIKKFGFEFEENSNHGENYVEKN